MTLHWPSSSVLGPLCAFGSAAAWAIGTAGYSKLCRDFSAFTVNFTRAIVALPLFILTTFLIMGNFQATWESFQAVKFSQWGWYSLSMIASYGLGDVFFLWSSRSLGVSGALAIGSIFPIWTLLADYFFLNEKLTWMHCLGVLISVAGVIFVILNPPPSTTQDQIELQSGGRFKGSTKGIFLAFLASFLWAMNSYATARGGTDVIASVGGSIRLFIALLFTLGLGRLFTPQSPVVLPVTEIGRYLWIFILEAFGGSFCYVYGISHSSLAVGATLSSLSPAISVPVTLALGIEKFSFFRTLGVVLVVVGVWFLVGTF